MAQLLNLPPELFIIVFFLIDNIDDALHFARTCKLINAIFEAPGRRLSIFTRVIQNGDHHKYDLQLHTSEKYCAAFRNKHYNGNRKPEDSERPFFPTELFDRRLGSVYKRLGADTVWSIVCRWHAMKVLFQLYCDSAIRPAYIRSIFWQAKPEDQNQQWQNAAAYELPIPFPSDKECRTLQPMTTAEKMAAYSRFYRSVCSHWLCANLTWAAGISQYVDGLDCRATFDYIRVAWCDNFDRWLPEKIEAVEVTDFVWGFLARKLFGPPELIKQWVGTGQIMLEPILFNPENMMRFTRLVRLATFYISPAHILELLRDMWGPSEEGEGRRLNKKAYLRKLGLWDNQFGVAKGSNDQAPFLFSTDLLNLIEWWGVDRIVEGDDDDAEIEFSGYRDAMDESKWREYRLCRWIDDLRGRPILYPETKEQLIHRIKQC